MSSVPSVPSASRGHRLWFLWSAAFLIGSILVWMELRPEMERNLKSWLLLLVSVVALILVFLWWVFLSRFPERVRLLAVGFVGLVFLGMALTLRVDGTMNGQGIPKVVWKWAPDLAGWKSRSLSLAPPSAPPSEGAIPPQVSDVPQLLGPHRDGILPDPGLERDWVSHPPRQLWRQAIGSGWSGFAVVGGRAYTQEQRGENEMVTCYELVTGRLLWAHANAAHFSQWQAGDGPHATPTVSEGRVYTYGATGVLDCLDAISGQLLWSQAVLEGNHVKNLEWGLSCSPLVFDDKVVVSGGADGPFLLAYHRQTGVLLWKGGQGQASYASPDLAQIAGRRVIVSVNAFTLTLHDVATGEVLVNYPLSDAKWPRAAQPTVLDGDRIFVTAGYGIGCAMIHISADASGKLKAEEFWKNNKLKAQFNSVATRGGLLYGLDDGMFACVDSATGQRKWKEGRYGSGQSLLVGDLALVQSEPGLVMLLEAGPDSGKEIAQLSALSSKTWNYPTLAGRYLLARNDREVVCYELALQDGKPGTAERKR